MKKMKREQFGIIILSAFLAACGGGDGGGGGGVEVKSGLFVDSAVEGIQFVSGGQSGITDDKGTFQYETGATVRFSIGNIAIGEGTPQPVMTPLDLVPGALDETHPTVINIARFVLTLDDDGDPSNGIKITQAVRDAALGKSINFAQSVSDFENDANVQGIISDLTSLTTAGNRTLISTADAQIHLMNTLIGIGDRPNDPALLVGTWLLVNENGVDVSSNEVSVFEDAIVRTSGQAECDETYSYTVSSNTITFEVIDAFPGPEGSPEICDAEIGMVDTATYGVSQTHWVLSGEDDGEPYVLVHERVKQISLSEYLAAGETGDTWTYRDGDGALREFTLSEVTAGEHAGRLQIGDASHYVIYDVDARDRVAYYEVGGEPPGPPFIFPAVYPLNSIFYGDGGAFILLKPAELTVEAGTFADVLAVAWLDLNFGPNAVNTELGLEGLNAAVTDVEWYAKGQGLLQFHGVDAQTGQIVDELALVDSTRLNCTLSDWSKNSNNPVFTPSGVGAWDDPLAGGSVLRDQDDPVSKYKMWYVGGETAVGEGMSIGYATSSDGINWVPYSNNPIMTHGNSWDMHGFSGISVIKDGSTYKMWYEGVDNNSTSQIGYATSSDGVNWTPYPNNPVFSPGVNGSWDDEDVGNPWIIKDGSTYKMWYWGDDQQTGIEQIGLATSSDGINWQRSGINPVLSPDPALPWENGDGVGSPKVIKNASGYTLAYHTSDQSGTVRVGVATSSDGLIWNKDNNNPILDVGSGNDWDSDAVVPNSLIEDGSLLKMWYMGIGLSGSPAMGLAVTCQ